jgi:preprotein translocase subunit SecF
MLEFIKPGTYIDFMKYKWYFIGFSLITSLIAIGSIAVQGFSYGIDFAGGSVIQVQFKNPTTADEIRKALKPMGMDDERIQSVGEASDNDFLIRTSQTEDTRKGLGGNLKAELEKSFGKGNFEIRRIEMVGSTVSKDIKTKGFLSLVWAAIGILIYVWWRFEFKFSVGAIVATLHDVIIVLGMFSLLKREMDLTVVAALLTLIGYSLNDTVVVFDRIRENIKKQQSPNYDLAHIMSMSISQTLSRTILTALTVFLVVIALFFLGGEVLHGFAMVMLIGVIIGCYSSIFIASPIVLFMSRSKKSSS